MGFGSGNKGTCTPPPPTLGVCWLKRQIWFHPWEGRKLWWVCTFESRLSLRHWTKTSCAGSSVVFHTFLCEQRRLWRVYIFASSSLSLRHNSKFSCWLKWRFNAILFEQRRLWRVYTCAQALAFITVPKSHVLPQMAIVVLFTPAANTLDGESSLLCRHSHWTMR